MTSKANTKYTQLLIISLVITSSSKLNWLSSYNLIIKFIIKNNNANPCIYLYIVDFVKSSNLTNAVSINSYRRFPVSFSELSPIFLSNENISVIIFASVSKFSSSAF